MRQRIFEAVGENLDVEHLVSTHICLPEQELNMPIVEKEQDGPQLQKNIRVLLNCGLLFRMAAIVGIDVNDFDLTDDRVLTSTVNNCELD